MYKWLVDDNEGTRNRLVRAMVINTLMSIIVGIWKVVGHLLSLGGISIVSTIIITLVSAGFYFYYLAVAMKYNKSQGKNQDG